MARPERTLPPIYTSARARQRCDLAATSPLHRFLVGFLSRLDIWKERTDLLVDFRPYRGHRLTLVNTAGAPFDGQPPDQPPGAPAPENRLAEADVMQFRVAAHVVDDPFVLPVTLSRSYRRLTSEEIPASAVRRLVALVEENGMLLLYELAPAPPDVGPQARWFPMSHSSV
jgi:hypothetical protein